MGLRRAHGAFMLKTVMLADGQTVMAWLNLPAVLITAAVTVVLVIGVKESAGFNAAMVLLNIGVILTVVGIGAAYIEPKNWHPFLHEDKGWRGVTKEPAEFSSRISGSTRFRHMLKRHGARSATWR